MLISPHAFAAAGTAVAFLTAGCAAEGHAAQLVALAPVVTCLDASGWEVSQGAADLDLVASAAPIGGIHAKREANAVTLAFADDSEGAEVIEEQYRAFASTLIVDVDQYLGHRNNVAWAWDEIPSKDERQAVDDCLRG